MDSIVSAAQNREERKMAKILNQNKKKSRLLGVPKLDDANDAGTRKSAECTLIVTEGDSAKALAMASSS